MKGEKYEQLSGAGCVLKSLLCDAPNYTCGCCPVCADLVRSEHCCIIDGVSGKTGGHTVGI